MQNLIDDELNKNLTISTDDNQENKRNSNKIRFSACFVDLASALGIKIEQGEVSIMQSMLDISQMTTSVKS